MNDPEAEVFRKLDQVVGKRFEEGGRGRMRAKLAKWTIGALCAVAAAALVIAVIETHRLPREMPQRAAKPVTVTIVPAKPL
jgi:hypothetical protein